MVRNRISFKNAHSLSFEAELAEWMASDTAGQRSRLEQLRSDGCGHLFLLSSEATADREELEALAELAREEGIEASVFDLESVESGDFERIRNICNRIQYMVKDRSVVFMYAAAAQGIAEAFASMFMLTLKSMRSIEPDYAIRYVSGRDRTNGVDEDRLIYRFKNFLNPSYDVPEELLSADRLSASVDAAVEKGDQATATQEDVRVAANGNGSRPGTTIERTSDVPAEKELTETPAAPPPPPAKVESAPVPATTAETDVVEAQARPVDLDHPPPSHDFAQSKFTIRVKLLSITSSIIILSLGAMIFFATIFFRDSLNSFITERNLQMARVIGQRVESELNSITYKLQITAATIGENPARKAEFTRLFFENNQNFFFVGIADRAGDGLVFREQLVNTDLMETNNITLENIQDWHARNESAFLPSFNGGNVVHNASAEALPLLGISVPLGDLSRNSIIVAYLEPAQFLRSFAASGAVTTFMVNQQGDVIAHPDSRIVLARENFESLPIVKTMLESGNENGQTRYEDPGAEEEYMGSFQKVNVGGLGVVSTVSVAEAFKAVTQIQRWNLFILGIVVASAILIVYFFAKSLSVPVVRLVGATHEVERGNYAIEIKPTTRDEIGRLTHSFSQMVGGLRERERMKDAMEKFVNKQIAEMALQGNIKLGGEEKPNVAVFFSDLRGFTAMSEGMTPEEVVSYLNEYFTGMVRCVNVTNGIVDKFIGDAVMAHWGAFGSAGNNTENAVNAALMMRDAIISFNKIGGGQRPFAKMGCGINTGAVVSGQIGSEERFEFTVIGDAVNLASRIEALNKPFGTDVLISQDSYDQVEGIYKVEPMPAIKVKGKSEPQVIYAVVGRNDDPNCPRDMDEVRRMLGIDFDSSQTVDPEAKEEKFEVLGGEQKG